MQQIRETLLSMAEEKYRAFSSRLVPGSHMLGVRLPALRALAKEIARGDWAAFLAEEPVYFEEQMLQGMVIGYVCMPFAEREAYMRAFIPTIRDWSVCDSFCTSLKPKKAEREALFAFAVPYIHSPREFEARFAAVTMLVHYLDAEHIERVLSLLPHPGNHAYYCRMGVAWALSAAYIKFPEQTLPLFTQKELDQETHNAALQKILDSHRVSREQKAQIRALKLR